MNTIIVAIFFVSIAFFFAGLAFIKKVWWLFITFLVCGSLYVLLTILICERFQKGFQSSRNFHQSIEVITYKTLDNGINIPIDTVNIKNVLPLN